MKKTELLKTYFLVSLLAVAVYFGASLCSTNMLKRIEPVDLFCILLSAVSYLFHHIRAIKWLHGIRRPAVYQLLCIAMDLPTVWLIYVMEKGINAFGALMILWIIGLRIVSVLFSIGLHFRKKGGTGT